MNLTMCQYGSRGAVPDPLIEFIINGLLTTTLAIGGIIGNSIAIYYLLQPAYGGTILRETMRHLAFWDSMLLMSVLGYYSFGAMFYDMKQRSETVRHAVSLAAVYFHPFSTITHTLSAWMIVLLSFQRYFAIANPLMKRTMSVQVPECLNMGCLRIKTRCAAPILLFLAALLLRIPTFFELRANRCFDDGEQHNTTEISPMPLRTNFWYNSLYRGLTKTVLVSLGPFVCVLFTAIGTLRNLKSANKDRRELMPLRSTRKLIQKDVIQEQMNALFFSILIIKFLATHTLPVALDLWELFTGYKKKLLLFRYLTDVSNFLVIFNSATNSLVYIQGAKFRAKLVRVISSRKISKSDTLAQMLSPQDIQILYQSFDAIWMERPLALQILTALLSKKPSFFHFFDLPEGSNELLWAESPLVLAQAQRITGFFGLLIKEDIRSGLFQQALGRIERVTKVHSDLDISFTPDMWKVIKTHIVEAARDSSCNEKMQALTAVSWTKLVNFVIKEMRRNFVSHAHRDTSDHLKVAELNH